MKDPFNKLARILRTQPAVLLELERKMNGLTGQEGVFEDILRQLEITLDHTLVGLGLSRADAADAIQKGLLERMGALDRHLYDMLGKPDVARGDGATIFGTALKVFQPPDGLALKEPRAMQMLEKYPPHSLLEHFGYPNVKELLDREGFDQVMASLRFTQSREWMHQFFDIAYSDLKPDDFEERPVRVIMLDPKWLRIAEKFIQYKMHNVSHLKEFGIIFAVPISVEQPGSMLRMFSLLLHYLHEVPFYAALFRRHMSHPDFPHVFKSLLRGDVPTGPLPDHGRVSWRIVQRYLAKDNAEDFRLFEPHVNPEADHWFRAEEDLGRLSRIVRQVESHVGELDLGWWAGLDFVGDYFPGPDGRPELVSFDLIDIVMSLVRKDGGQLYHQQEALWNKIFVEYFGRERMNRLIAEHLLDGFITLE